MSRSAITAAAFAVSAGEPVDALSAFYVDPQPCPRGRRIMISVEPLAPSPAGSAAAAAALAALRRSIAADALLPPPLVLLRAFARANAALLAEHRPPTGGRRRDTLVGATAAILTGRQLVIAQVPPSQAIVAQERRLYAFPDLASWRPDFVPATDDPEPEPLGLRNCARPALYRTLAAPGDVFLFCSSPLARCLGRDHEAIAAIQDGGCRPASGVAAVSHSHLAAALEQLEFLAAHHGLEDAHAAAVAVDRLPVAFGGGPILSLGLARLRPVRGGERRPIATPAPVPSGTTAAAVQAGEVGAAARRGWFGRRRSAERQPVVEAPTPRPRPAPPPRIGRTGPLSGAASVHRYTGRSAAPAEWRGVLPRGPDLRLPGRALVATAVAFAAFGGSGFAIERHLDRSARADVALATVDASLATLNHQPSAAAAMSAFGEADDALSSARRAAVPVDRLADRQRAVDDARDHAWGIDRFAELSRVGVLPDDLAGQSTRLVRAGDRIFLLSSALYELDPDAGRLVRHLGPGDRVGDGIVEPLHFAAADGSGVVAGDGSALYARDAAGAWTRRPFAPPPAASSWPEPAAALYQGSLYLLAAPGEITEIPLDGANPPLAWAAVGDPAEVDAAVDLAIDGRVHLLLGDGRIQTLFRGLLEATLVPAVSPPVTGAVALAGGPDTTALYLLDPGAEIGTTAGRVVRLSPGGAARQLLPPGPPAGEPNDPAAHVLARAHDLVVDEATGVVYLITDDELWRGVLPAAEAVKL